MVSFRLLMTMHSFLPDVLGIADISFRLRNRFFWTTVHLIP